MMFINYFLKQILTIRKDKIIFFLKKIENMVF